MKIRSPNTHTSSWQLPLCLEFFISCKHGHLPQRHLQQSAKSKARLTWWLRVPDPGVRSPTWHSSASVWPRSVPWCSPAGWWRELSFHHSPPSTPPLQTRPETTQTVFFTVDTTPSNKAWNNTVFFTVVTVPSNKDRQRWQHSSPSSPHLQTRHKTTQTAIFAAAVTHLN